MTALAWLLVGAVWAQDDAATPPETSLEDPTTDLAPEPEPAPEPAHPTVQLVYTGASGGVGSSKYPFIGLNWLQTSIDEGGAVLGELAAFHGTLAQGDWLLHPADWTVASLVAFLDGSPITCGEPIHDLALQTPTVTWVLEAEGEPDWFKALESHVADPLPWTERDCTNGSGLVARLAGPDTGLPLPDWRPLAWELRLGLHASVVEGETAWPLLLVGRPLQERARTAQLIADLQAAGPQALFVDAGDFVDGASSVEDGALSLHRAGGFSLLQALAPAALAPGEQELVAGARAFVDEIAGLELPYVASNWQAADPSLALPDVVLRTVQTADGPVALAFVGVLDPALNTLLPSLGADGVTITDPVAAVQAVVDRVHVEHAPDAVIALASSRAVLEDLRRRGRGIDLLAGDPTMATLRVVTRDVAFRELPASAKGSPLTLAMDGVATADLTFGAQDGGLSQVRVTPRLVTADLAQDPQVTAAITQVRLDAYPRHEQIVLPHPPAGPTAGWTQAQWEKMVCELTLARTGADAVWLREFPPVVRLPGPMTALELADQLAMLDVLELHRVPGTKLGTLLLQADGEVAVSCGAAVGSTKPKVRGRGIDGERTYLVATTDRTRLGTPVDALLKGVASSRWLDQPSMAVVTDAAGSPLTLRRAALEGFRAGAAADAAGFAGALLAAGPSDKPGEWLVKVRALSLHAETFRGTGNDAFASVPETLATSPSSLTLGASADVALDYSARAVAWDLRWRAAFTRLATADDLGQETADDWRLSTSTALPRLTFPSSTPIRVMPYGELAFDSEFTPAVADDGSLSLRQADLSLVAGLSATKWRALRALRVGLLINRDLARLQDKPFEYGARVDFETLKVFGPSARLSTYGAVDVYGNTPEDDASDLRFKAFGEVRLALPLARYLDLALYAQGFALQGRVPDNDALGAAWTLGTSLDMAEAFQLRR